MSCHARTKLKAEQALLSMRESPEVLGLRVVTLCGSSPRMRFDLILNTMIAAARHEHKVVVYGGLQWKPIVDVMDVAAIVGSILTSETDQKESSVLNISHNQHIFQIGNLAKIAASVIDDTDIVVFPDYKNTRSYRVDFTRLQRMGFDSARNTTESISDIISFLDGGLDRNYTSKRYYNSKESLQKISNIRLT